MSAQAELRTQLLAAMTAEATLANTQVLAGPPGENQEPRECVWIAGIASTWDWRSLGVAQQLLRNRQETLTVTVKANVYREAPDQMLALADADARVDEIVDAIEHAVAAVPDVGGSVTFARVESAQRAPQPAQAGWLVDVTLRVVAENYP